MGYPMSYDRVVNRNHLTGDYGSGPLDMIRGDLRRLEKDTQDDAHVAGLVAMTGATEEQVRSVLKAFFAGCIPHHAHSLSGNTR